MQHSSRLGARLGAAAPRAALVLALTSGALFAAPEVHAATRVVGTVRDLKSATLLPGATVEVVGTAQVVQTDVDGRYRLDLEPGTHELKVSLDGFQERRVQVEVAAGSSPTVDVGLAFHTLSESIDVLARVDAVSSSAEAQLAERRHAPVITDNMGAREMKANGDSDAASAMARVTGLSVVDSQYVYVRGLGERYSNTTLSGSVVPTTEPDKKVVPLDLFPSGLIDSVQVAKTYSPDKSAEFAGGLVQIVPLRLPYRRVLDFSIGAQHSSTATGKSIPLSPLGTRDRLGYDNGTRALPAGFPHSKIVRRGIYSPSVGYSREEITAFGRLLDNRWRPEARDGALGETFSFVYGDRLGRLGIVASLSQSYKEQYVEEDRRFFRIAEGNELEAVSDYAMRTGTQKAQLGAVANLSYEVTPNHRLSLENFYTHSGRDEGRVFEGPNTENNFIYRNERLQFIEEGLLSNSIGGEHFFQGAANTRIDWRATYARATRDEPDLRETLYQQACVTGTECRQGTGAFLLADESQSGFRMFNTLDDDTVDAALNWSFLPRRGRTTMAKLGLNYVKRTRDFSSRRFRLIPNTANTGGSVGTNLAQAPEALFASAHIGTFFRFNEETRPVDAYDGEQNTFAGYGLIDTSLGEKLRLVGGVRVERFEQVVDTFDPFGLFERSITSRIENTDVFPAANFIYAVAPDMNLRFSASVTVNRPEFRELAPFEFTDVVGSRSVRGNPGLERALIRNLDARWELIERGRDVIAASAFFKQFDRPIERVVIAGAQPIVTFQNSDSARNFGFELEAARQLGKRAFVNLNYTFVDSRITLRPEQRSVQTSLERPLAGQSRHIFNGIGELDLGGFSARLLYNYFGDRISDVGSNEAPDIVEQGRGSLDAVFTQELGKLTLRLVVENLTDSRYVFTQGPEEQRAFKLGRHVSVSLGVNVF
ncbi:MAG TPA: TonB-dependent receptor [Vicinamibacteria bacterium]|nr:TonB-dependent receptor [Vicinamibacteria bacterium]